MNLLLYFQCYYEFISLYVFQSQHCDLPKPHDLPKPSVLKFTFGGTLTK